MAKDQKKDREQREKECDFSHLGLSLAFSAAYINGMMTDEHPEIRKHWYSIRDFLLRAHR